MRIKVKSRSLAVIHQQRSKIMLPTGQAAVIKIDRIGSKSVGKMIKVRAEREKIALKLLQGLAVPKIFDVKKKDFVDSESSFECVVLEWLPWQVYKRTNFGLHESAGVWLFMLEQLCAFRRRGILYTDLKPAHILVKDDLSQGCIIDFDWATAVSDNGIYHLNDIGISVPFMAPECSYLEQIPESAAVYTATLMFAAFLRKKGMNNYKYHGEEGRLLRQRLRSAGHAKILKLLEAGLSSDPKKRPESYETLFKQALSCLEFPKARRIWKNLRSPYHESLLAVGLEFTE